MPRHAGAFFFWARSVAEGAGEGKWHFVESVAKQQTAIFERWRILFLMAKHIKRAPQ